MSTHQMEDGTVVGTENATNAWDEHTYHDGSNVISQPTRDQFLHQTLYRSRKGRYYLVHFSDLNDSFYIPTKEVRSFIFALALTRIDAVAAGRAYAAYGGIYILSNMKRLQRRKGSGR
ncbi:MAG: hypothetical protein ACRD7E_04020 [Bryobacteraceae bacterium]